MSEVPYGLCQCGCGESAPIAKYTHRPRGWKQGEPLKFIQGHNRRQSGVDFIEDSGTGCWIWQLYKDGRGYGYVGDGTGRVRTAHRVYYELMVGPVPEGLELDHVCQNPSCMNPGHMEPVTHLENMRRGKGTKLTAEQIEQAQFGEEHPRVLATRFGVTPEAIAYHRRKVAA